MLDKINDLEKSRIEKFKAHPLFIGIGDLTWDDFLEILIQRRYVSLSIVNVYELVIDALLDEEVKQTVRGILNEEFPRNTKGIPLLSHRELLFHDLLNLGATPKRILKTPETQATKIIRDESYKAIIDCLDGPYSQAAIVAFLRFWAEVLVSVEYACLWPRISERLSHKQVEDKPRSEFYYFHMMHDHRSTDIGEERILGGLTHAQELALHLKRMIASNDALALCLEVYENAYQLKYQFYSQFIRKPELGRSH